MPINPFNLFFKIFKLVKDSQAPILEPTKIKLFFLTIFFIKFLHHSSPFAEIFPFVNFPDDFP